MKKRKMAGVIVAVLAALLTACGSNQTAAESTAPETGAEIETTVAETETALEPSLTVSVTEWEIGYGTPVLVQGDIPVSRPVIMEEQAEKETGTEPGAPSAGEGGQETPVTSPAGEEQPESAGMSSAGRKRQEDTGKENREPVILQLAMTDIESCSYEVKTVELVSSWEEEYKAEESTSEEADSTESLEAGYHFEGDKLFFDRLGKYEIVILAKGADGQELSETVTVTVIDDIPPFLYVPEEVTYAAGDDWTEFLSECVAEDEIDGNLTGSIVFQDERENPFDPETPGEYLLRFSVRDHSDNEAAVVCRITVTEKKTASRSSGTSGNGERETNDEAVGGRREEVPAEQENSGEDRQDGPEGQQPPQTPGPEPAAPPAEAPAPEPAPEPEPEPEPPVEISEYIDGSSIVGLINAARAEAGLGELSWEDGLLDLAKTRAYEQSIKPGHERPDGSYIAQYYKMGECAAYGQSSVQAVFDAWMASDGHRAALLWETHTKCCLAGYRDSTRTYWVLILE